MHKLFNKRYTVIIIVGIIIDQLSKALAEKHLEFFQSFKVITNIFYLQLVHNYGAAYGILQHKKILLLLISFTVLVVCYLMRQKIATSRYSRLGLSFLFIGTIGNFIDRLFRGYVIDFIDIKIFPVFNFADIAIDFAIIMFVLELILYRDQAKEK